MAELHVIEGRNGDAVSLLERYLKDWADDSLHVKLAQVFAATNMLQEALSHYQAALRLISILIVEDIHVMYVCVHDFTMPLTFCINGRLNPQNEAAKRGLERLEKQMKVYFIYLLFNIYFPK